MPRRVARVESYRNQSVWIRWALAFALSACLLSSLALAATEKLAEKSEWVYFNKNKPELGCFPTDLAAANAIIADSDAGSDYICQATFLQWDTAWPNGVGITDQ